MACCTQPRCQEPADVVVNWHEVVMPGWSAEWHRQFCPQHGREHLRELSRRRPAVGAWMRTLDEVELAT